MRQVLSKFVGPDPPFSVSNAPPPPLSNVPCIRRSSLPSNLLSSPITLRLCRTTSQPMARTSATTAPIEPPMAAPRDFESKEGLDALRVPSVAFPDELTIAVVGRDVALVARLD